MVTTTASLLHRNLTEIFGARDASRRRAAIAELTTDDVVFTEPNGRHVGRAAMDAAVAALQARLPNFVFTELPPVQIIEGAGRVHWGFGPPGAPPAITGVDLIVVRDGRIAALYTFLDPKP